MEFGIEIHVYESRCEIILVVNNTFTLLKVELNQKQPQKHTCQLKESHASI